MRIFLMVLGTFSCLISGVMFFIMQRAGWRSDGPGLLCPLIICGGATFIGAIAWFYAFATPPSGPPPVI